MSEYWKSVPRKFCDFCKCWITDNKPSIEFHERGKRHKENVELRLKEVRKKSLKQSEAQDKIDEQMAAMEKAALEAFKKDLKDNPQLAAQYGVSLEAKPESKAKSSEDGDEKKDSSKEKESEKVREWYEAVTPEGYHYYWSTATGESVWEAPDEYVSVEEQEEMKKKTDESVQESSSESKESEQKEASLKTRVDPSFSRSAYGAWSVVREESQPTVYDETSEAPALDDIPLPSVGPGESKPRPEKQKFKEKIVTLSGLPQDGTASFKKRKIASGARNIRSRDNDD